MRFKRYILALVLLLAGHGLFAQPPAYKMQVYDSPPTGYYFLHTYKIGNYDRWEKGYQLILDGKGHTVYFRQAGKCFDFKLQLNGLISYFGEDKFYLLDSSMQAVDSVWCVNGIKTDLHDLQILPDRNYLLIGTETVEMDLSAYHIFTDKKLAGSRKAQVQCGVIQELDTNKKVVFEWHARDHFRFDDVADFFMHDTLHVSWTHFNSIEQDNDGNFLLTIRNFNEITKINSRDGSVMWRMGGKRNQFRFMNDTLPFLGMHDARRLGDGNIALFDNGQGDMLHNHASRAVEYHVNEKNKTVSRVWVYERSPAVFSIGRGNMHRTAGGYTLVNYGEIKTGNIALELVSAGGKRVSELSFNDTLGCYRAFYYTSLPWSFRRPVIRHFMSGSDHFLEAGEGYGSYLWSTGDTGRTISIEPGKEYAVYVPYGAGYAGSEMFALPDTGKRSKLYLLPAAFIVALILFLVLRKRKG